VAVLGLILLVAAGVLTTAVVTSNTGAIDIDLWGVTISNVSLGVVFVAGMLTTLVGVAGLILMTAGVRRNRRLRQERRVLRQENQRLSRRVETADVVEEADPDQAEQPAAGYRRDTFFTRRSAARVGPEDRGLDRNGERVEASDTGTT
jgi:hypothetical protein